MDTIKKKVIPPQSWRNINNHFLEVLNSDWYKKLCLLQDFINVYTVLFYKNKGITTMHLPITTGAVSSPMGLGSDSQPVKIKMFDIDTYLADSMQFMLEYGCRINGKGAYYIMPSFRGEKADDRHLCQFYHSEAEIVGRLQDVMNLVEEYVRFLSVNLIDNFNELEDMCGDISHIDKLANAADIYKSCGTCGLNFKCYAPPEIIRVDIAEMNTNILFLATCHGITFSDGILPMDMGLALKFVSKSGIACISSYTILSYNAEHIMGFYYLYQSGMPLGECVRLTNNLIISKLGVNAPYVLLGDPIICNNYTTSNRVHIESINEQANYGKSYSLKYPFDSNDLLVKIDKVNTIDEVNQFKKILKEQFGYHDLLELRNFLTDDLYNGFEKLLKRIKTTRNNYSKVIMGFYDALKILHLEALKKLTKEAGAGKWFYEYYIHDYEINGEKTIRVECPNCNSPSDLVTYDCIYEQYMNRFTILCPKCGIVRDFNIIDSKIDLNIQLNLDNNKADEVLISKLQISNTGDKSEFISIMPVVYLNPSAIKEDMIHQFLLKAGEVIVSRILCK